MKTWGDYQPFNPDFPGRFKQGRVPPLPYDVTDNSAAFTAKLSNNGQEMQASWPVDKQLLAGVVGKFEMEVSVNLQLEVVYSNSLMLRVKKKRVPISLRAPPGFKEVLMSSKFKL